MDHRTTHYALWFLFFGVIASLSSLINQGRVDATSLWFLATGLLGLIVTRKWLNEGKLAVIYDLVVGIIFGVVGVVGILLAFKVNLLTSLPHSGVLLSTDGAGHPQLIGLSLAFFNSLVYAVLGLTSLNHGIHKGK